MEKITTETIEHHFTIEELFEKLGIKGTPEEVDAVDYWMGTEKTAAGVAIVLQRKTSEE